MFIEIFFIIFLLFFHFFYSKMFFGRFRLPAGPTPLPFVGNLIHLDDRRPQNTIFEWSKKYGPVFTMWIANTPVIIITDYEIMKDAATKHSDQLSGRYMPFAINVYTHGNHGILFTHGDTWKEARRFSVQTLRNFGMSKNEIDKRILRAARHFSDGIIEEMNSERQVILDLHNETVRCISGITASMLFGKEFSKGDQEYTLFRHTAEETIKLLNTLPIMVVNSWPWMRHIPLFGHFGMDELTKQEEIVKNFVMSQIKKHKEELKSRLEMDVEPQDFLEAYLKELKRREDSGEDMSTFSEWQLVSVVEELLIGGLLTTVSTLRWAFLAMIQFPHIQQKIFEEIDHVIGPDRSPSMPDRSSMPYVMATLNEVHRWGNVNPFNVSRTSETDFVLAGYKIPKHVEVIPQVACLAIDEKVFPNPDQFIPERFLEDDGMRLKKIDQFAPFSLGKRLCLAEPLASADLFLILVHMIQHFELSLPPGAALPTIEPGLGFSAPEPFKVLLKLRKGF